MWAFGPPTFYRCCCSLWDSLLLLLGESSTNGREWCLICNSRKRFYVVRPPQGSIIPNAFKAMWIGLMSKGNIDAAKPSYQEEYGRKFKTPWDDLFVDEIKRALIATRVFLCFHNQMTTNLVSQGKNRTFSRGVAKFIEETILVRPVWYAYKANYHTGTSASRPPVQALHSVLTTTKC